MAERTSRQAFQRTMANKFFRYTVTFGEIFVYNPRIHNGATVLINDPQQSGICDVDVRMMGQGDTLRLIIPRQLRLHDIDVRMIPAEFTALGIVDLVCIDGDVVTSVAFPPPGT